MISLTLPVPSWGREEELTPGKAIELLEEFAHELETAHERARKLFIEGGPGYARAKTLFDEGWRLEGWGLILTDTDSETILRKEGTSRDVGYWADGSGRNTEECYGLLGLDESSDEDEYVLIALDHLTEEVEEARRRQYSF